jgi:hypothetical protein
MSLIAIAAVIGLCLESRPALARVDVITSGYLGYPNPYFARSIYWLDNEEVLFIGRKVGDYDLLPDGRRTLKSWVTKWNITTGSVTQLARLGESPRLCYDGREVTYWYVERGQQRKWSGILGQEMETGVSASNATKEARFNWHACNEYDPNDLTRVYGTGFRPLKVEHGLFGSSRESVAKRSTVYISLVNGQRREVLTPIFLASSPRWSEFAQAYVFGEQRNRVTNIYGTAYKSPTNDEPSRVWLLRPSGEVRSYVVPSGPWFSGTFGFDVVNPGLLLWSYAGIRGAQGAYLVRGSHVHKILDSYIHGHAVSPDGCKVAIASKDWNASDDTTQMAAIDLCR